MNSSWDNLSISDKAKLMSIYVKNGITDINFIRNHYNKFEMGGDEPTCFLKKNFSTYEDRPKTEPVEIRNSVYKGMSYEEVSKYSGAKELIDKTALEAGVPKDKIAEYWDDGKLLPMMEGRYPNILYGGLYIGNQGNLIFYHGAKKPNVSKTSISRISDDAVSISSDVQETNRNKQIYGRKEKQTLPNLKYGIQFLPETGIVDLGNGSYTTYNALDSLAKYGVMENLTPEEYLGLPWRETKLGRYVGAYAPSDKPQSMRAYYNMNYFNNYGFIPAENLVNDWAYNEKDVNGQSIHSKTDMPPLQHAFQYFKSGKYNPGEPGHTNFVLQEGKNILANPDVQKWMAQSKYVDHTHAQGGPLKKGMLLKRNPFTYNVFDVGGPTPEGGEENNSYYYNTGIITQDKPMSKLDVWRNNHLRLINSLRKVNTLGNDLLALHPILGYADDTQDYIKGNEEKTLKDDMTQTSAALDLFGEKIANKLGEFFYTINKFKVSNNLFRISPFFRIPDFIMDTAKFIEDFSTPVEEFDGRKR